MLADVLPDITELVPPPEMGSPVDWCEEENDEELAEYAVNSTSCVVSPQEDSKHAYKVAVNKLSMSQSLILIST